MRWIRHLAVPWTALAALSLAPVARSQTGLRLSGTYVFAANGSVFGGACGRNDRVEISCEYGRITFKTDGSFSATTLIRHEVCTGGVIRDKRNQTAPPGKYILGTDGILTLDFNPSQPGTEIARLHLRPDRLVAVGGGQQTGDDPWVAIAIKTSSGRSNATLAGNHHVGRIVRQNAANGLSAFDDLGTIDFKVAGSYAEKGRRHSVSSTGSTSNSAYNVPSGSFRVASDGSLTAGSTARPGAVSADGEIFFWIDTAGVQTELTVGVRRKSGATAASLYGDWGGGGLAILPRSPQPSSEFTSNSSRSRLQRTSGQDRFTVTGHELSNTLVKGRSTNKVTKLNLTGTFTVNTDGSFQFKETAGPTSPGAVGASRTYAILADTVAGEVGMDIALKTCAWPLAYGTATAGTGGVRPALAPAGSFPFLGNLGFGLVLAKAVGGSVGILGLSALPAKLPVLGGILWIDPRAMFLSATLLSGAKGKAGAGTARFPIPIPNQTAFAGLTLYFQGFVLDGGAPQGVAMTKGLETTFCR